MNNRLLNELFNQNFTMAYHDGRYDAACKYCDAKYTQGQAGFAQDQLKGSAPDLVLQSVFHWDLKHCHNDYERQAINSVGTCAVGFTGSVFDTMFNYIVVGRSISTIVRMNCTRCGWTHQGTFGESIDLSADHLLEHQVEGRPLRKDDNAKYTPVPAWMDALPPVQDMPVLRVHRRHFKPTSEEG